MRRRLFIVCSGETTTSRVVHLRKITRLAGPLFEETIVISEDMPTVVLNRNESWRSEGRGHSDFAVNGNQFILRVLRFVKKELKVSKFLLSNISKGDIVLFLGIYQPLSLLAAKVRGAATVLFGGGFDVTRSIINNKFLDTLYLFSRWIFQVGMLKLFRRIILESPSVENSYNLNRFEEKIFPNGHLYVEDHFSLTNPQSKRDIDLAYVGVLSREKGILEFLESLLIVIKSKAVKTLILGDGEFRGRIKHFSGKHGLQNMVEYLRYVEELPKLFNRMRLLVMPSYAEGLPNRLLEAMACGTPVLATPVGAIPDVIKEGKTGFLLKSNDPEHIAERVVNLLNSPQLLERVGRNAYRYVKENFTYEKTLQNWRKIFLWARTSVAKQGKNHVLPIAVHAGRYQRMASTKTNTVLND